MDYGWTVEEDGSLKSPAPSEETLGGEYSTPPEDMSDLPTVEEMVNSALAHANCASEEVNDEDRTSPQPSVQEFLRLERFNGQSNEESLTWEFSSNEKKSSWYSELFDHIRQVPAEKLFQRSRPPIFKPVGWDSSFDVGGVARQVLNIAFQDFIRSDFFEQNSMRYPANPGPYVTEEVLDVWRSFG